MIILEMPVKAVKVHVLAVQRPIPLLEARMIVLIYCESEDETLEPFSSSDLSEFLIATCFSCQVNLLCNTGVMRPVTHPICCGLAYWHSWPLAVTGLLMFFLCILTST